jgi:hypothetical protein
VRQARLFRCVLFLDDRTLVVRRWEARSGSYGHLTRGKPVRCASFMVQTVRVRGFTFQEVTAGFRSLPRPYSGASTTIAITFLFTR